MMEKCQLNQDSYYVSLLALAETFRTDQPPRIRYALHCLQAVLTINPPPKVAARTHLQVATLLARHANNPDLVLTHLHQAWSLSENISGFDDVRFEAVHRLAAVVAGGEGGGVASKALLLRALDLSQHCSPQWHCRLLLQTARVCLGLQQHSEACEVLQRGFDYTNVHELAYLHTIFLFSKIMVLMMEGREAVPLEEVQEMLTQGLHSIDGLNVKQQEKDHLKVFALVLLVTNQLNMGQVKSAKPALKQLQHSIQAVSQPVLNEQESPDGCSAVVWMPRAELGVLVYLVSVRHSMHAGYMDKANKYTEKALSQIQKLKGSGLVPVTGGACAWLELLLVEHTALCHLVVGSKQASLNSIAQLTTLLRDQPRLSESHAAQVHTLLAVYAMTMNNMEAAEHQFNAALRTSQNRELWTFASLNLGLVYLRLGREQEFFTLQERIHPSALASAAASHSLRAAAHYVKGMHSFFTHRHDDAKRDLREALKMANAEDLNRLTSCALVLLGHLFSAAGSAREAANMASPAMQLAAKIPDLHLQLWAAAILKDIHHQLGESSAAAVQEANHRQFSQTLLNDHQAALQQPHHHTLLSWTTGPLPVCAPDTTQ